MGLTHTFMTFLHRLMQFVLQCFNEYESWAQNRIQDNSPEVDVAFDTQFAEQTSLLQDVKESATHEDSIVIKCASESNMTKLEKTLIIHSITNFVREMEIHKQTLLKRIDEIQLAPLNPSRRGKKCVVVDIDFTILGNKYANNIHHDDHRNSMRPHLHLFFTKVYKYYDIMIWSARDMASVSYILEKLEVLFHPDFNITALIDRTAMATVKSQSLSVRCKPLDVIWAKYPDFYNSKNTIIVDDISRNFLMNPLNGVPITPYEDARIDSSIEDSELILLSDYLVSIADSDDLSTFDHQGWKNYKDHVYDCS